MKEQVTNFTGSLWVGLTAAFTSFMNFIPALLGAVIILMVGWFISKFVGSMVERLMKSMKVERAIEGAHLSGYLPHSEKGRKVNFSAFVGGITKWFVFMIFIQAAVIVLGIEQLTTVINSIILFIPNILVAAIILIAGAWSASFVSGLVQASSSTTLATITRYGILGFAVIAAVSQLGIATNLINILFTGFVASLSLAFGLAFGLGGKSAASDITRSLMEKNRSYRGSTSSLKESVSDIERDDQLHQ